MTSPTAPLVLHYAAFTANGGGGNPAGVVLDARGIEDVERLAIAVDVGYSETAFIEPTADARRFRVRYFSPMSEVGFCGHATIASAVALADRIGVGDLVFETRVGLVDVDTSVSGGETIATLTSVPTATAAVDDAVLDKALAALRWARSDLDERFPPQSAYGGMWHLVLVVHDRRRLADLDYDVEALRRLMVQENWITVDLLWAESAGVFHARNPFPTGGVYEDPATGAAAAAFGGYLRNLRRVGGSHPSQVVVLQGVDMGRPSKLLVDVDPDSNRVRVSGAAHVIGH